MSPEPRNGVDGFAVFLRRNLALVVALFSLFGSVSFGYANYKLLEFRVAELEQVSAARAANNLAIIKETRSILDAHLSTSTYHLDPQKWEMLMTRLSGIERSINDIQRNVRR